MSATPSKTLLDPQQDPEKVQWLLLDLNSYFASVEQELQPQLRGRPIAVVPTVAETTSCIAVSYEAKAFGVKTGTRVSDARQMCPGIVFVAGDHKNYIAFHHRIVAAVESCIPVERVLSIDEVACRLMGSQELIPNAVALAHKIKRTIAERVGPRLRSSIGLAPNMFLAKVASDMQKPDGLVILRASQLPQSLYGLQLRDLPGIGAQMEKRLHAAGIRTIQKLCSLESADLHRAWGSVHGDYFYKYLKGEDFQVQNGVHRSISHSNVLAPEIRNEAGSYEMAQKLLHKAASRLRKIDHWCRELYVSVSFLNGEKWKAREKLLECRDNLTLLEAFKKMWVAKPKHKPIKVSIWLNDLVPDASHSFSFFDQPRRDQVSKTFDKIQEKFGREAIAFGSIRAPDKKVPTRIAFTNIPDMDE